MSEPAYLRLKQGSVAKGDVLGVARIAGIMAAKKVDQLIPLCHPLAITGVEISFELLDDIFTVRIEATRLNRRSDWGRNGGAHRCKCCRSDHL